jgi:hypothetical protein
MNCKRRASTIKERQQRKKVNFYGKLENEMSAGELFCHSFALASQFNDSPGVSENFSRGGVDFFAGGPEGPPSGVTS